LDFRLGEELGRRLTRAVRFGNDGNCAALGEARFGVGAGAQNLVYLALGTGVGGGVIAGGRLIEGAGGFGGELGHVVVALDGPRCTCGSVGCLEAFVGGWAIAREAALVAATADGAAIRAAAGDGAITASAVAAAAAAGDAAAGAILERAGRALGAAIGGFVNAFNPELVVLGGGITAALGEGLLEPARRSLPSHAFPRQRAAMRLETSTLGDDTALLGAAALALAAG
jgi:glucokinase